MGKKSRTKGANYEREVAKQFNARFPQEHVERNLDQYQHAGLHDLRLFEYDIECKRRAQRPAQEKWLGGLRRPEGDRALEGLDSGPGTPLVVTRGDNGASIVCMYLDDFIDLLHQRETFQ